MQAVKHEQAVGDTTVATALCVVPVMARERLRENGVSDIAFPHYTRKELMLGHILRIGSRIMSIPDEATNEELSAYLSSNLPHQVREANSLIRILMDLRAQQDGKVYETTSEFKTLVMEKLRNHYNMLWDYFHYCADGISCAHMSRKLETKGSVHEWFDRLREEHKYLDGVFEDRSSRCHKHKCVCQQSTADDIRVCTDLKDKGRREQLSQIAGNRETLRQLPCEECHVVGDYLIAKSAGKRRFVTEDAFQHNLAVLLGADSILVRLQRP